MSENNNIEMPNNIDENIDNGNQDTEKKSDLKYSDSDVDKIVSKKVARERARYEELLKADDKTRSKLEELEEREKSITAREINAHVTERLLTDNLPKSLSAIFKVCKSVDDANTLYDEISTTIKDAFEDAISERTKHLIRGNTPKGIVGGKGSGSSDYSLKSPNRR